MAAVEVWGATINTWECDVMGHLNVRFYVAKATEGLAALAAEMGMPGVLAAGSPATLMVREHHIRFIKEARPADWLSMTGGVLEMGETDARLLFTLHHADGRPSATLNTLVTHVTADGRPFPWPPRIRERAAALAQALPDFAAPRSLSLDPVESSASLERAEALGLRDAGRGVIDAAQCDAFGRMRVELFMGKLSDGAPRVMAGVPPIRSDGGAGRVGGAVLEYRLLYLAWPRAGSRYWLRSGLAGVGEKTRRLVHWLLDPDSGRPWAVAEAIGVGIDLDARKVVTLSPEAQAELGKHAYPGLAL